MGNIYNDLDQKEEKNSNNNLDNILSVGKVVDGWNGVRFRDNEINRVYNIMDKTDFRTVLLVGDYGSGKRSIIEGYVNKLEQNARADRVITLDFDNIIQKARTGDFGQIMEGIFNAACQSEVPITIVLPNIGHLLNLNCFGNAGFSFVNNLVGFIEEQNLKIIATATTEDFKNIENMFNKILDYFTVIKLTELTKDETAQLLADSLDFFKGCYDMEFPDNVCELICNNADKYIKDRVFPGKADNLFDEVCASISNKYRPADDRIVKLSSDIKTTREDLAEALVNDDYAKCEKLNKKLDDCMTKFKELEDVFFPTIKVTEEDILEALGDILGVQMTKLDEDKTKFLREMPVEIKKYVIGQDNAIDTIVKNIRRNQLGLRKTSHSAGNFMFIGSTGVGKTYLAKRLAKYLYGSEDNLLRLDMSEFQTEIDVTKLLGSAPGYVGYKESGLLVKGLAKKGETVVLFDEIEKAHPKIYDVLLQLLDEGFITGSDGKKVDATKALIIFTSNIGVKEAQSMSSPLGFTPDKTEKKNAKKEEIIRKALKKRFSPEFLNRLDNICYFNSLSKDTLRSILQKELDESNVNIKAITGKMVKLSKEVEDWILDKVEKEDNGARPIIRIIQQYIEEIISDMVINENPMLKLRRKYLVARLKDDQIVFEDDKQAVTETPVVIKSKNSHTRENII